MDPTTILFGLLLLIILGAALTIAVQNSTISDLKNQVGKFDHDGDGKPGGSRRRLV